MALGLRLRSNKTPGEFNLEQTQILWPAWRGKEHEETDVRLFQARDGALVEAAQYCKGGVEVVER